nr:hypothetical protein [Tanacetum cinerariifolium]
MPRPVPDHTVLALVGGSERHEHNAEQKEQVGPDKPVVEAVHKPEDAVVRHPVNGNNEEADKEADKFRNKPQQPLHCGGFGGVVQFGHPDFDNQQRDGDGKHRI